MTTVDFGKHCLLDRPGRPAAEKESVVDGLHERALTGLIGAADHGSGGIKFDLKFLMNSIVIDRD